MDIVAAEVFAAADLLYALELHANLSTTVLGSSPRRSS